MVARHAFNPGNSGSRAVKVTGFGSFILSLLLARQFVYGFMHQRVGGLTGRSVI